MQLSADAKTASKDANAASKDANYNITFKDTNESKNYSELVNRKSGNKWIQTKKSVDE